MGCVDKALVITQNMVDVQKTMADTINVLARSNEKMVNYYFVDGGHLQKSKENSPEGNK